jgi:hypothetical protein
MWHPFKVVSGLTSICAMVTSDNYKEPFRYKNIKKKIDLQAFILDQGLLEE